MGWPNACYGISKMKQSYIFIDFVVSVKIWKYIKIGSLAITIMKTVYSLLSIEDTQILGLANSQSG